MKRSRLEIFLDVLKAIDGGTRKPTRIMYRTNVPYMSLMKILDSMADQGLIAVKRTNGRSVYSTTEKGRNALAYFDRAFEIIEIKRK